MKEFTVKLNKDGAIVVYELNNKSMWQVEDKEGTMNIISERTKEMLKRGMPVLEEPTDSNICLNSKDGDMYICKKGSSEFKLNVTNSFSNPPSYSSYTVQHTNYN